ncbi:methyl-accepting chemotaxis protein [Glaciecola sp. 1036]|uniref:methyl-accepting chemotaxis protein n=1 Tax=Alteromonadaceae TaxID=72275 RepID=UPI003D089785
MPIQRKVASLNLEILRLGTITTNAYYEQDLSLIKKYKSDFDSEFNQYSSILASLKTLVDEQNIGIVKQIETTSSQYQQASLNMFQAKFDVISSTDNLQKVATNALNHTNEASALMLDLSYLENDSADFQNLLGMTNNIDNKLSVMLNTIEELVNSFNPEKVEQNIGDIEYNISNVQVDVDYAKRIASNIDDEGIFVMFDTEHMNMINALTGEQGVFAEKRAQMAYLEQAKQHSDSTKMAVNDAITELSELARIVDTDTLNGQESILSSVQSNVIKSAIASVFGLIATIVLAVIATRSISKPLSYVNEKLALVSEGDLTQKLHEESNDEFSILAKSINSLIASLNTLIAGIKEKEQLLREVMVKSVDMGDKSLAQVAQQQEQIDATFENTNRVRQTSVSNVEQISMADKHLVEALQQSESVMTLSNSSSQQMQEQSAHAKESAAIVNRLGENTEKIGSILDVIKTIAEQTNLLALNAAIEAARAGEQGRGFAVVADEVRTLATRTHDSTEEIENMIASLQRDAKQAISAMNRGEEQVEKGVEITQQVSTQVSQIKNLIQELANVNRQIVSDSQQQDELLAQMVERLETIVHLSKDSADSTQASNDATHQIEYLVNELSDAVKQFRLA